MFPLLSICIDKERIWKIVEHEGLIKLREKRYGELNNAQICQGKLREIQFLF